MDFDIIYLILFIVLPLLARLFGNKDKNKPRRPAQPRQPSGQSTQPADRQKKRPTLEEILQQLGQEFDEGPTQAEEVQKTPDKQVEAARFDDHAAREIYEKSQGNFKTIDEQISIEEEAKKTKIGKVESEPAVRKINRNTWAKRLRNVDEARKAVIYKEIFDRRHF